VRGLHEVGQLGTVLGVWGHPDDETYLSAGIMAAAVLAGQRVACVTATRGEAGSSDEERWPSGAPLAAVRTAELDLALGELGVTDHTWLDYPDGGCAQVDDEEAIARICAIVERVQPDTILTFGPDGMTGHDDHKAASRWATAAAARAGKPGIRVHYATNTPDWLEVYGKRLDDLGVYMGSVPPCTPHDELSIDVGVDGDLLETKVRALLHQTSQIEPLADALGIDFLRDGFAQEAFRPA
jgi:LmbE family N-acetylglucosaminyl deacetylase